VACGKPLQPQRGSRQRQTQLELHLTRAENGRR
jgi:hypothetical protein